MAVSASKLTGSAGRKDSPAPCRSLAPLARTPRRRGACSRVRPRATEPLIKAGLIALLSLAVSCAAAAGVARAEVIDRILAVVGRDLITLSDVSAAIRLGLVPAAPAGADQVRTALDALIVRHLELTEANRYQPPEPSPASVEQRLEAVRASVPAGGDFAAMLGRAGLSGEQLRLRLRDDLRIEAYLAQRFGAWRQPSEAELLEYYRLHEAEFSAPAGSRPYSAVRDEVRQRVVAAQRAATIAEWLESLRRRTEVTDLYVGNK